jgi:hypothetical protein
MYANDRFQIGTFLSNVYNWLSACYVGYPLGTEPLYPLIEVRPELKIFGETAWTDFSQRTSAASLVAAVNKIDDAALEKHGLFGAQLTYKLQTVSYAAQQAISSLSGWKRKLLDLIDNLLDSILAVLGTGEALKEMKDALIGSLPDED